jgi:hypothetical protein
MFHQYFLSSKNDLNFANRPRGSLRSLLANPQPSYTDGTKYAILKKLEKERENILFETRTKSLETRFTDTVKVQVLFSAEQ